jgi:hypothetical protein
MPIENWRLFIQERLRAYEPTINLDDGSPASVQIVEPIVDRLSPDPIETDSRLFILTRLQQEHPQLFAEEGAAMSDMLAKPHVTLLEPLRREIRSVKQQLSLQDSSLLTADDADALMRNFFMNRQAGAYAKVRVRLYFVNNVSVNLSTSNVAYTANGLRFLPTRAQSITSETMLLNVDSSGLYYFDATYQAERPGSAYSIGASEIVGVTGIQAATRATNLAAATPGTNEETTAQFVARGESSMGERSTTTAPGTVAALRDDFADLKILQIIGFNDTEMQRDIIKGGNLGAVLYYGADGSTSDDGDSDGYTPLFDSASGSFTSRFGPVGTDISGYQLDVWYTDTLGNWEIHEFTLKQVEGATQISISDDYDGATALPDGVVTPPTMSSLRWAIRQRAYLTISDVPGGLEFPDVLTGVDVDVPDDEVHVGGCTDVYVRGGSVEEKTLSLSLVSDEDVIARREDAQTTASSADIVLNDLTSAEWSEITEGSTSLYLEQGTDAGAYRIIEKKTFPTVRVGTTMTGPGATDLSYILVDDIDIDLLIPKEIRYEGTDLRTVAGSATLQTTGLLDFAAVGVTVGDYINILNGDDEGEYEIDTVAGTVVTLLVNMTCTASPLQYEIYRKQDGIDLPLLRVKTVELLDSNLDPTGSYIPYKHPVDARSNSFQNPGREPKAATDLTITEDTYLKLPTASTTTLQAVDELGVIVTAHDWYALGVRRGDIINVETTDNQGFYRVEWAGGDPDPTNPLSNSYEIRVYETVRWPVDDMEYTLGPPSYGSFRLYFFDPVTFEANYDDALFAITAGTSSLNFRPDPDVWTQVLPTEVTIPTGRITSGQPTIIPYTVAGVNVDLLEHEIAVGDRVEITYAPLVGSEELKTGGYNLDGKYLRLDLGLGTEQITFSGTSLDVDTIVSQMNAQLSSAVAFKYEDPSVAGDYYVGVRGDHEITIISDGNTSDATEDVFGTDRQNWQLWLSSDSFQSPTPGTDRRTENVSPEKGFYLVSALASYPTGALTVTETNGTAWTSSVSLVHETLSHYIRISKEGMQRISATEMEDNQDENGLYYFDVECIGEGHGSVYNIVADYQATVTGYSSEGWDITTAKETTSFSMSEEPTLHIGPRVLFVGTDDDWTEKEELTGRSIQITYERDPIVDEIQNYLRDTQTRVLVNNPLVRSLLPIFVRTAIEYRGGGTEADVRAALVEEIESILPNDELEADAIAEIIRLTGSTKVVHPINLVGIAHQTDRTITTERSVDSLSNGRLSALLPDDDGTTVEGASFIDLTRTL